MSLPIKACSPHTKRNYKISVKLYVEFLRVIKGTTPETLSAECFCMEYIMEWIIWLKENRGCSPATCNVRLSALRVFLKYLSFRDISYMSVFLQAENVPNEKNSKRKVIGLSKQAVDVLLSMPNQGSTIGFRDYTLMLLLYSTAVRINELLTLKISNIVIDCVKTSHNSHWQRKKETSDSSFGQASTMLEKVSYQIPSETE